MKNCCFNCTNVKGWMGIEPIIWVDCRIVGWAKEKFECDFYKEAEFCSLEQLVHSSVKKGGE